MKKQLIFLLAAVSLLSLAQSPQRFPGGVIGKYFQKSGSSSDSVLLGSGSAKAIKDLQLSSGGGAGANVYLSNTDNQIAGYKTSQPTINATEVTKTITASTPNVTAWGEKYLYALPISTTVIPSGLWTLHLYGYVDSPVGVSKVVFRIFKYSSGVETTLYTFNSFEVDDITKADILTSGSGTEVTLLATDYIGVQVGFTTTSTSSRTLTYSIGDGNASYSTNPLPLRHSSLRDKNGEPDFQHLTTSQVAAVNNIVGIVPENSANKGQANGYTPLDQNGKISTSFLPAAVLGALKYQGSWAASVGAYPASPERGNYWVISTAGTLGSTYYNHNDWLTYNGSGWDKVDNQQTVSSVNGKVGAVTISANELLPTQTSNAGKVLSTDGTNTSWTTPANGTVTSVGLSSSSVGLTTTGPVTTSGNLTVNVASGYAMPTTTALSNAATAYSWGNHASAGYAKADGGNATGTWPISINGTSNNATTWNTLSSDWSGAPVDPNYLIGFENINHKAHIYTSDRIKSWLGLGSAAYQSDSSYFRSNRGAADLNTSNLQGSYYWTPASANSPDNGYGVILNIDGYRNGDGTGWNNQLSFSVDNKISFRQSINSNASWTSQRYFVFEDQLGSLAYKSPTGSAAGKVLTATDANGNSIWQTPAYSSGEYTVSYGNLSAGITALTTDHAYYSRVGNIMHVNVGIWVTCTAGSKSFEVSIPATAATGSHGAGTFSTSLTSSAPPVYVSGNAAVVNFNADANLTSVIFNLTFDYVVSN